MLSRRSVLARRAERGVTGVVLLTAVLLLLTVSPALAFPDVPPSHPYSTAIDGMAAAAIIGGFDNGTFGPDKLVIRQQFAKMVVLTLDLPVAETDFPDPAVPFVDLGDDNPVKLYPHEYVAICALNGITRGTDATHFSPGLNIRRTQVISMVVRAADNLAPGTLDGTPVGWNGDLSYDDPDHGANIKKAEFNALLDGIQGPDGTLASWDTTGFATRGEVAQILWNLLNLLGPPAPSEIWVYADGSGDYPTIEAAVTSIDTGATIHLGPGEFRLSQTLDVDFSFNLVGSGMAGPSSTVISCDDTVVDIMSVNFSAQDIRFENTGAGAPTDVMIAGDATIDLQRCYLAGGVRWQEQAGDGLYLYGTATGTVTDCVFTLNDLHGIEVDEDAQLTVENSVMSDNGDNGITFWANSGGIVRGNECTGNGLSGIAVNENAEALLENNVCSDNQNNGIRFGDNATGTIRNNECSNNADYDGIALYEDSNALIEDNTCLNNAQAGIYFTENSYGTARGNECAGNQWGIYVRATADPVIGANDLHGNTYNLVDERLG